MTSQAAILTRQLQLHERRISGMLADPELGDDLLLVGIALARRVDGLTRFDSRNLGDITEGIFVLGVRLREWHAREVIAHDIRRYDPWAIRDLGVHKCGAPMIRRDGLCGRYTSHHEWLTDLNTGETHRQYACRRPQHRAWLNRQAVANRDACTLTPPPTPAANAGGVLERHIPEIDWDLLWKALRPTWVRPPEREPWTPPEFRLVIDPAAEATSGDRPELTPVNGGGDMPRFTVEAGAGL